MLQQYEKIPGNPVIAVQINLELDGGGVGYRKWGGDQWAKQGDWIVDNDGEAYTIDAESFARTYSKVGPGQYVKTARVWAEEAQFCGQIQTKEGASAYEAGDMLVYNEADRGDGYCVSADKFREMYRAVES